MESAVDNDPLNDVFCPSMADWTVTVKILRNFLCEEKWTSMYKN